MTDSERGYQMHNPLYPYPTDGSLDFRPTPPPRATRRVLSKLRQSIDGLETAAELAVSPKTRDLARAAGERRAELERKLTRLIAERNGDVTPKTDLAGRLHRARMRLVTSTTDARLLAEMDRGEASAEHAAERAIPRLAVGSGQVADDQVAELLSHIHAEIVATRDMISHLRDSRESDPAASDPTDEPNWHRRGI